jgi:hypothetical protein
VPLTIVPVPPNSDISGQQWTFPIAMGVRHSDQTLAAQLDSLLKSERPKILKILDEYGVPRAPGAGVGAAPEGKRS